MSFFLSQTLRDGRDRSGLTRKQCEALVEALKLPPEMNFCAETNQEKYDLFIAYAQDALRRRPDGPALTRQEMAKIVCLQLQRIVEGFELRAEVSSTTIRYSCEDERDLSYLIILSLRNVKDGAYAIREEHRIPCATCGSAQVAEEMLKPVSKRKNPYLVTRPDVPLFDNNKSVIREGMAAGIQKLCASLITELEKEENKSKFLSIRGHASCRMDEKSRPLEGVIGLGQRERDVQAYFQNLGLSYSRAMSFLRYCLVNGPDGRANEAWARQISSARVVLSAFSEREASTLTRDRNQPLGCRDRTIELDSSEMFFRRVDFAFVDGYVTLCRDADEKRKAELNCQYMESDATPVDVADKRPARPPAPRSRPRQP
jgi:hypothetical protein